MTKKKFTRTHLPSAKSRREPVSWKFCITTILFGVLLAGGFFSAARQHFFSMDYGIRNSRLKTKIEDLRSRNRRLRLEKEVALSPETIREAAGRLGLIATTVRNLAPFGADADNEVAAVPETPANEPAPTRAFADQPEKKVRETVKQVPEKLVKTGPRIVKTVKSEPVRSTEAAPVEKQPDPATATRSRIIDTSAKK